MDALVFDTSAILNFGQRDDLQPLLSRFAAIYRLTTTPDVVNELSDPDRKEFNAELVRAHFTVQSVQAVPFDLATLTRLAVTIDPGELSVMLAAKELKGIAVIDERLARQEADTLGIKLTGTLGLLRDALENAWLTDDECLQKVRLLRANKFRIRPPHANESFAEYFRSFPTP